MGTRMTEWLDEYELEIAERSERDFQIMFRLADERRRQAESIEMFKRQAPWLLLMLVVFLILLIVFPPK